jgi:hypothetical protein
MGGIVLVQPEDNVDADVSDPNAERQPVETILDMMMLNS